MSGLWSTMFVLATTLLFCSIGFLPPGATVSEDGTFYDVPLKILRVLSHSRCATVAPTLPGPRQYLHLGPGAESVAFYLQIAYQVPSVTYEDVPLAGSMEFQSALPQIDAEEQQEYVVLALDET